MQFTKLSFEQYSAITYCFMIVQSVNDLIRFRNIHDIIQLLKNELEQMKRIIYNENLLKVMICPHNPSTKIKQAFPMIKI